MKAEIFVVNNKKTRNIAVNAYWSELEALKADIIREFGGLTEIPNCKGYWNDSGEICVDNVEIWLICGDIGDFVAKINAFAKQIKTLTHQKTQLYIIDNKPFFV